MNAPADQPAPTKIVNLDGAQLPAGAPGEAVRSNAIG
jgi:hypothetical protein